MFVYNDQPTTFNSIIFPIKYKKKIVRGKKVCEECRKERRYRIILGGLVRYGWTRWQHCTACSEFVIALVSETRFLSSLSLSLTRGIRDSNIFRIRISKLFAQIIQIRILKMFYDHLPSSNYPFFHRSCKTSFTINAPSSHALSEWRKKKGERNFQRAMNMHDSPINVSRIHPCYSRIDRV